MLLNNVLYRLTAGSVAAVLYGTVLWLVSHPSPDPQVATQRAALVIPMFLVFGLVLALYAVGHPAAECAEPPTYPYLVAYMDADIGVVVVPIATAAGAYELAANHSHMAVRVYNRDLLEVPIDSLRPPGTEPTGASRLRFNNDVGTGDNGQP